jgi:hypothetical protein
MASIFLVVSFCLILLLPVHSMHAEARAFLAYASSNFSSHFKGAALDVVHHFHLPLPSISSSHVAPSAHALRQGSMDINGNNREYFAGRCEYTGCDVLPGANVDIPLPVHRLPLDDASFDVIMSTGWSAPAPAARRAAIII